MRREVDLKEISDGKLYTANDMVKADCQDCKGCSACCREMGASIVLDPLDIHRLTKGMGLSFQELLDRQYIELNLVDGVILPNLKMKHQVDMAVAPDIAVEQCPFLDRDERCSIHVFRPGFCRMFPLGRSYDEEGFRYFLQIYECPNPNRSKVKVKKWLDTPNLKTYEKYIWDWHQLFLNCAKAMPDIDSEKHRTLSLFILRVFYQTPFEDEFYEEFYARLEQVHKLLF